VLLLFSCKLKTKKETDDCVLARSEEKQNGVAEVARNEFCFKQCCGSGIFITDP
jgi:hypothetical protein